MQILLHPTYCPNIQSFALLVQHDVVWEVEDNFQKQTFRNRCYICTDQGKHMLNIPIQHAGGLQGRQKYKDVRLDNSAKWQRQHWRSLQTAYRTSPFFEYYEDDLAPLYMQEETYLMDFNLKSIAVLCDCLQLEAPKNRTIRFQKSPEAVIDARFLVNAKKQVSFTQAEYNQVFGDRHGFIANLSVLDLLFNVGPNSVSYLLELNPGIDVAG